MATPKNNQHLEDDEDRPRLSVVPEPGDDVPEVRDEKPRKRVKLGTFADIWPKKPK